MGCAPMGLSIRAPLMLDLTREQAQAFADVLIASDEIYSWSIYDDMAERFPNVDWISLCEPDAADPRERVRRPAFIGPRLPNEASRVMVRQMAEMISGYAHWSRQPSILGQAIAASIPRK
jgi:hypothetical protein